MSNEISLSKRFIEKGLITLDKDKAFEVEIYNALRKLEIPAHVRGYEFLKSSLRYLRKNPNSIYAMTKEFYPGVAKLHNTTASKVERAIRHAISLSKANDEKWYEVMGCVGRIGRTTGRLSNSEFISTLLESIKIKMAVESERFKGPEHYHEFHESRDELQEKPNKF